jgi:hypothetical protein
VTEARELGLGTQLITRGERRGGHLGELHLEGDQTVDECELPLRRLRASLIVR